ncbi:YbaB/EbfC family nucleoid-associated protein [Rhodococcus rhodochrous]|uniref:YbaB/EbfC family nucleoid-associated protein n=1 Tax=Rhodococcus rhodochrous TaxID=1829 RepID=UPI001E28BC31|nr:YbaB/EbfC family nucleoid-associated protein [Rhodococcus rhodochrous]MCB8909378.1 YbaB/EbfC family nucleoid-associated protein [Rhodococcus rhodochrous]
MSERMVEAIVDRAHVGLDALERTVERLGAVRGTASSPDGRVTARVDGSGALEGLELAEPISGTDPRELAAVILATVHEAARRAAVARVSAMDDLRAALAASDCGPVTAGDRAVTQ